MSEEHKETMEGTGQVVYSEDRQEKSTKIKFDDRDHYEKKYCLKEAF